MKVRDNKSARGVVGESGMLELRFAGLAAGVSALGVEKWSVHHYFVGLLYGEGQSVDYVQRFASNIDLRIPGVWCLALLKSSLRI